MFIDSDDIWREWTVQVTVQLLEVEEWGEVSPWARAPAPAPMPDVLVDDEPSCPMAPCWLPGGKVLRHLSCCGNWACCPGGALVALWVWMALPLRLLHCTCCIGADCPYCLPVAE
jgi:hypothetical protein